MKRFISFALVFIMLFTALPINVIAEDDISAFETEEQYYKEFYECYDEVTGVQYSFTVEHSPIMLFASADFVSLEEAGAVVRQNIKERNPKFTVYIKTKLEATDILNALMESASEHTGNPKEGDYIRWQYGGFSAKMSRYKRGEFYYYTIPLEIPYFTTLGQEVTVDAEIKKVLDSLDLYNASDYDKIKGIYDYVCNTVEYDYDNLEDTEYLLKHSAYAALINKTAVCQGYALLIYRLALELGVDCRVVAGVSYDQNHGWNIVKLNGRYYNIDSTWDHNYAAVDMDYEYFLKCNSSFTDHVRSNLYTSYEFNALHPMACLDYDPANTDEISLHIWDDGAVTAEPSHTTYGEMTYTCSICSTTRVEQIDMLEGHTFGEWVSFDENTHKRECVCGETETEVHVFDAETKCCICGLLDPTYFVASGTCGDNVVWKLSTDGVLTVSGTGEVTDYGYYDYEIEGVVFAPWCEYSEQISSISVGEGITSLGNSAFHNLTNVSSVSLPESLTEIDDFAFEGCESLQSLKIPNGVEKIGDGAFSRCKCLRSIDIPNGVTEIDMGAFIDCISLTTVTLSETVESVGLQAFARDISLTSITFKSATTEIDDSEYTIPESATIYGHAGSTAQAYAEKYDREFVDLATPYTPGDIDGNEGVDNNDAIYLLYASIFGFEEYPVNQSCDFDGNGIVDNNDAIYLLYHTIFEDDYPLS